MSSRKLEDGRWEHVLHQSDIAEFDFCLQRGQLAYLDQFGPTDTDSTVLGTCVHEAIEYALTEKRDHQVPHASEVLGIFDQALDGWVKVERPVFDWKKYSTAQELRDIGHTQVDAWLTKVEPKIDPRLIEHPERRLLHADNEREVYLAGTLDCMDTSDRLHDWKTGEAVYKQWEKQRYAIQPTVYSYLYQWWVPSPWHFRFTLLRPNGKVEYCDVTRTPEDHAWLREKVLSITALLELELPTLPLNDTGWHCSSKWCPAWDQCKGAHVHEDWAKVPK